MKKFEKLKFKEIHHENTNEVLYMINDKYVTKEVYNSVLNDETLYNNVLPPLPKVNKSSENKNNSNNSNNNEEYICNCEKCEDLKQMIYDIQHVDKDEAFNLLRSYLEILEKEVKMEALIETYSTIGNNLIKHSGKLENQLEDFLEQFEDVEETEDDYEE